MHLESVLKAMTLSLSLRRCLAPCWPTQEKLMVIVEHVPVAQCWIISSFTAMIFDHRQIIQPFSLCFWVSITILPCNLGTVRVKFELRALRSCGDEAIEMPGQLDEVVALFGCLSEREEGGKDKKKNQKLQPQTKATARTSGRNSSIVTPC